MELSGLLVLMSALAASTYGDPPVEQLRLVINKFWDWRLRTNPEFATFAGDNTYNDKLFNYSLPAQDVRKLEAVELKDDLEKVMRDGLDQTAKLNYDILLDTLSTFIDGSTWARYSIVNPISFLAGIHIDVKTWVDRMPFTTSADYSNYLSRLHAYAEQIQQVMELMKEAVRLDRTYHNASMEGVTDQIENELKGGNVERMTAYKPFNFTLDNTTLSADEKSKLRLRAIEVLTNVVVPKMRDLKAFVEKEYIPNTRLEYGVDSWDKGSEYYRACLKWHLSVDTTPDELHKKGKEEVERILVEITNIKDRLGFTNMTIQQFLSHVRKDPQHYYATEEELLAGYREIISDVIRPRLTQLFTDVPNIPVTVEKMPYDGPPGTYRPPKSDGSGHGTFLANTHNPSKWPKFWMTALCLHEADPGHHMQATFAMRETLVDYRRLIDVRRFFSVPAQFPFHTAYMEGWALYAEILGKEMNNVFRNDYELLGLYSSEIFRACRLVVDTGLHAKGWTQDQAERYILERTVSSEQMVRTEVRRYITWPGQATAYKIGQLKISQLRRMAASQLGDTFDVKAFHSVILRLGPVPLRILEQVVTEWVDNQLVSSSAFSCCAGGLFVSTLFVIAIMHA